MISARGARMASVAAAAASAVFVAVTAFRPGENVPLAIMDATVGFVLLAGGSVAFAVPAARRSATIMVACGAFWMVGALVPATALAYRGPFAHLVLSYPDGRLRWLPARMAVGAGYAVALSPALASNPKIAVIEGVVVAVMAMGRRKSLRSDLRRADAAGVFVALMFSAALILAGGNAWGEWEADRAVLWCTDLVVAGGTLILVVDLIRRRWAPDAVAGVVVSLGATETGILRDHLADALGDPKLTLGYWLADEQCYVDDAGQPVEPGGCPAGRIVTTIQDGSEPLAVLIHEPLPLDDTEFLDGVAAAAKIAITNARSQATLRGRMSEIARSRRRMVEFADAQRHLLVDDLQTSVRQHLLAAESGLRGLGSGLGGLGEGETDQLLCELRATLTELDDLAVGIRPMLLTDGGLAPALAALVATTRTPVEVRVWVGRLPTLIESTIYFTCAEALANISKHARASRATVTVERRGSRLTVSVTDDGAGGADRDSGTGLRGMQDRVEAVGGTMLIKSPHGGGTSVVAHLDLTSIEGADAVRASSSV